MAKLKGYNDLLAKVLEQAGELGFEPQLTRGGHLKFSKPGRKPVFASRTPSDHRAAKNAISDLRKSDAGVL